LVAESTAKAAFGQALSYAAPSESGFGGADINLSAEVRTGNRWGIGCLLSPLQQRSNKSLREGWFHVPDK